MSDEIFPIDWAKLKEELKASGVLPMKNRVITVVMPDARWSRAAASLMTNSTDGIHPIHMDRLR